MTPPEPRGGGMNASIVILSVEDMDRGFTKVATVRRLSAVRPYAFVGIFRSAHANSLIREAFFDQRVKTWRIGKDEEGPFAIAALEYAGEHQGEATFKIELKALRDHPLKGPEDE